ncbi:hypothetical protein [Novosphingobium aquimarinum]|uniref:hypothetical protein n=1 Tax=Novosphingobium aquimarinum TaxID=2682494 RepID=UPI0012EBB53F|nr:hypothetical protein [Novosphingobium aquimarinum]
MAEILIGERPLGAEGGSGGSEAMGSIEQTEAGAARWVRYVLPVAIVLTLGHRLWLAFSADFPYNDGALFLAFVNSIGKTFPALPATVDFNGLAIPFAYPPLSFWIGAGFVRLGMAPLDVVRFLPILFSTLYVLVFAAVLHRMRCSAAVVGLTLLFLLSNARAFEWLVMGGGLSRSLGALFFALTLLLSECAVRQTDRMRRLLLLAASGLTVSAAIVSHPEFGLDSAVAVVVWHAFRGASLRQSVLNVTFVGALAALGIAPWVIQMLEVHGIGPYRAASQSRGEVGLLFEILIKLGRHFLSNPLALLGLVLALRKREWLWPALLVATLLATPRHGLTPAALILAVLAAEAFFWLLSLRRFSDNPVDRKILVASLIVLLILPLRANHFGYGTSIAPLTHEQREAMAWVARNAPHGRFVLANAHSWDLDRASEWFPLLTGATGVNTVQGREWLNGDQFNKWVTIDAQMKSATSCDGIHRAISRFPARDYIWIEFALKCFPSAQYPRVYANSEVVIVRTDASSSLAHENPEPRNARPLAIGSE